MKQGARIPKATYRHQFNCHFTFDQARNLVDYFDKLGITDFYSSPLAEARPGSLYGYDVTDYGKFNPEIGDEEAFEALAQALQERGMGFILDIVPNHMCIDNQHNVWWNDVLENGPSSPYSGYFDIDWNPPKAELKNKVLLPLLDDQFGWVIERGAIKVSYGEGAFFLDIPSSRLPVNPVTWTLILTPVAQALEPKLGPEDPHILELLSILTALEHLPGVAEADPLRVKERHREKEIIKNRLRKLVNGSAEIGEGIEASLIQLNGKEGDPHSFDRLEALVRHQAYRLCFWRVANDEINYRRFFDINDLAGIRAEHYETFAAIHALAFRLIEKGWVTGLRIDHIDGMLDPEQYFHDLQHGCLMAQERTSVIEHELLGPEFYVVAEKILSGSERLRQKWLIHGTTGYDFMNMLNGVFVKESNKHIFYERYASFTHQYDSLFDRVYACKIVILTLSMASELQVLARQLDRISEQHRWSRDFTLEGMRGALRSVIASFPVYRSYIRSELGQIYEEDRESVLSAIYHAKRLNPGMSGSLFHFIRDVLLLEDPTGLTEEQISLRRKFVMRFQQLTGPIMAKGLEDTFFYQFFPLASLNEVGGDPSRFGCSVAVFHARNLERLEKWPDTMLATSTHDTKRGEDVRARLNLLSEIPEEWWSQVRQWHEINAPLKESLDEVEAPDSNDEYLLYQTLVGTWPLTPLDDEAYGAYIERIVQYMNKALKEAKTHTSWINPSDHYDQAMEAFIRKILDRNSDHPFLNLFIPFVSRLMLPGLWNALAQVALKVTSPGVPDFYQGTELWSFTLVDPDNRAPVDYVLRQRVLQDLDTEKPSLEELVGSIEDGRIKLYLTMRLLRHRKEHSALFAKGSYLPLTPTGEHADHLIAFAREYKGDMALTIVGRHLSQLAEGARWDTSGLILPRELIEKLEGRPLKCLLTGKEVSPVQNNGNWILLLNNQFTSLPLLILTTEAEKG